MARQLKPLRADSVRLDGGYSSWGYGINGRTVGGGIRLVLIGCDNNVTDTQIEKRVRALIERHLDEIVEVTG